MYWCARCGVADAKSGSSSPSLFFTIGIGSISCSSCSSSCSCSVGAVCSCCCTPASCSLSLPNGVGSSVGAVCSSVYCCCSSSPSGNGWPLSSTPSISAALRVPNSCVIVCSDRSRSSCGSTISSTFATSLAEINSSVPSSPRTISVSSLFCVSTASPSSVIEILPSTTYTRFSSSFRIIGCIAPS